MLFRLLFIEDEFSFNIIDELIFNSLLFDLIGNNLFVEGAGFQGDTNVVCLITKESIDRLPKLTKSELGYKILKTMSKLEKEK